MPHAVTIRSDSGAAHEQAASATETPSRVELAEARDAAAWDAYVERKKGATIHHLFGWKHVAENAYGLPPPLLVAREGPGGGISGLPPPLPVPPPAPPPPPAAPPRPPRPPP